MSGPSPIDLDNRKLFFIAIALNVTFYFLLLVQLLLSHVWYPCDSPRKRAAIYSVFALETAQVAVACIDAFVYARTNFAKSPRAHGDIWRSTNLTVSIFALGGVVICAVQFYYCYRITVFAQGSAIGFLIALLPTSELAMGFIAMTTNILSWRDLNFDQIFRNNCLVWGSTIAICDVFTICATVFYVKRWEHPCFPFHRSTRKMVTRFLSAFVGVGGASATGAMTFVILVYFVKENPNAFIVPALILSKFYSLSLMTVLNSRPRGFLESEGDGTRSSPMISALVFCTRSNQVGPTTTFSFGLESGKSEGSTYNLRPTQGLDLQHIQLPQNTYLPPLATNRFASATLDCK